MEKEIKQILEKILSAMQKNRELYDYYPRRYGINKSAFTVIGLCDLAGNHLFDDRPEFFGITQLQGHKIREYFHGYQDTLVKELYREFPEVFDGESKKYFDNWKNLPKNIPLF